jgi:hypothetical protein
VRHSSLLNHASGGDVFVPPISLLSHNLSFSNKEIKTNLENCLLHNAGEFDFKSSFSQSALVISKIACNCE